MNNKEQIIEYLKKHNFLDNILLSTDSCIETYKDIMSIYFKWCIFLEYPVNYNSFYYFLCEVGTPSLHYGCLNVTVQGFNHSFYAPALKKSEGLLYDYFLRDLIVLGYDKL